ARRHLRCFGITVVDHPAPGPAFRICAALVIGIAELVLADPRAQTPGVEARAERLAVPPGKELDEKFLHYGFPEQRAGRPGPYDAPLEVAQALRRGSRRTRQNRPSPSSPGCSPLPIRDNGRTTLTG